MLVISLRIESIIVVLYISNATIAITISVTAMNNTSIPRGFPLSLPSLPFANANSKTVTTHKNPSIPK